jgi:hypothetical protein
MSEEKECQSCKQTGPGKVQIGVIVVGFYMIFTSIYGTIQIVKELINYFK